MAKRTAVLLVWAMISAVGSAWAVPAHTLTPDMARLSSFDSIDFSRGLTEKLTAPAGNKKAMLHSVSLIPGDGTGSGLGFAANGVSPLAPVGFAASTAHRSGARVQASIAAGGGLPLLVNVDPNNLQGPRLVPAFGEPVSLTFLGIGLLTSARFLRKKVRNMGAQ